jgi:two-component system, OmpR family, sensor kinase
VPIRWRLAGGSALLTLIILMGFAVVVGTLTTRRIQEDFNVRVTQGADDLANRVRESVRFDLRTEKWGYDAQSLEAFAAADHAVVRLIQADGSTIVFRTKGAPRFGFLRLGRTAVLSGYRVESRYVALPNGYPVQAQYGRPLSEVEGTKDRVRFLLVLGVLGGSLLALCAGLLVARNAMRPIAELTATAREVGRTRDPDLHVPISETDDEVAELARTLDEMLSALAASREETEAMLARQRQFVADASHELRTPLTSVLANLELLTDVLDGERGEAARSALRSTQRMRRLVADLLLLARADVGRASPHAPTDLARMLVEAAAELEPVAGAHVLEVDAHPVIVEGARDELHRMALNLMENAVRHTPPGTHVTASVTSDGQRARLIVEDDGPGVPAEMRGRIFERFVRGEADHGRSFGLGLSIVKAVVDAHAGRVVVEEAPHGGARFVVELPLAAVPAPEPAGAGAPAPAA